NARQILQIAELEALAAVIGDRFGAAGGEGEAGRQCCCAQTRGEKLRPHGARSLSLQNRRGTGVVKVYSTWGDCENGKDHMQGSLALCRSRLREFRIAFIPAAGQGQTMNTTADSSRSVAAELLSRLATSPDVYPQKVDFVRQAVLLLRFDVSQYLAAS